VHPQPYSATVQTDLVSASLVEGLRTVRGGSVPPPVDSYFFRVRAFPRFPTHHSRASGNPR
jgi:hypothetical protein